MRLQADLSLFTTRSDDEGPLRFDCVRKHVIAGDVIDGVGYALSAWHGRMDFVDRLADLDFSPDRVP